MTKIESYKFEAKKERESIFQTSIRIQITLNGSSIVVENLWE